MAIYRQKVTSENFTIISNEMARDARLSLKARGLLAYMLTHDKEWNMTIGSIAKLNGIGRTQVTSALEELKSVGYAKCEQSKDESGRFYENDWFICDTPKFAKSDADMLPVDVKPVSEKYASGNQTHKNTNNKKYQLKELSAIASEPDGSVRAGKNSYTEDFENLWISYKAPTSRKGTKKTAFSRYKTLRKEYSSEQIQAFMDHYLQRRARAERSGEFIPNFPNLSTWLNQEKWNDFGEYREGSSLNIIQKPSKAPQRLSKEEVDQILGKDNFAPPMPPQEVLQSGQVSTWIQKQMDDHFEARHQKALEKINGK